MLGHQNEQFFTAVEKEKAAKVTCLKDLMATIRMLKMKNTKLEKESKADAHRATLSKTKRNGKDLLLIQANQTLSRKDARIKSLNIEID